ncbi:homocysteine S-methyltransferase family protein [Oleidesulfovibrio sp.]|uniref:homocysteine S-methyltransferase family protein n=1 Tax=Oleidesulfovibrio sp. TaxID=2909707 RepID=UPI003A8B4118
MSDFRRALTGSSLLYFDGAMGTMLQGRGLPAGMSPEVFCLQNPDVLQGVHLDYAKAGADVLTTNTFGGTRLKLPADMNVVNFNREMAKAAKAAASQAGRPVFVAGSVGPTGHFVKPLGELEFTELVEIFREQIQGLVEGGVDLILAETHFDLAEVRAVVLAARQVCSLPVGVSMTFEDGVSLTGTRPEVFAHTVQNMGVDLVATNCSAGPEQMAGVVAELVSSCGVPVLVMPNAGLPELDGDGNTVFRLGPEAFARQTAEFARLGVKCLGGCCGTTPDHITALVRETEGITWAQAEKRSASGIILTTRSQLVRVASSEPTRIIGERINPTGKKELIAQLQAGELSLAMQFAQEQIDAGAPILDVNVGAPMVNEKELLPRLLAEVAAAHSVPLSIDSSDMDAVEASLAVYAGSPLVNSISGEPGRMERLGPLCRDYGAPFILLPLKGRKLPVTAKERIAIIDELLQQADELGIPRRLVMVDVLALAVSSKPEAARHCFDTIRYCNETLGLPTTIGLSNISFGLPARELLNSTFLSMAIGAGLTSCIAHPGNTRMREALAAAEVLMARDSNAEGFIAGYSEWTSGGGSAAGGVSGAKAEKKAAATLEEAVIKGERDLVLDLVEQELANGAEPYELVNNRLIPAITEVGDKYERKEYYLPQLLRSAETMQKAFGRLKPLLEEASDGGSKPVIIMATVEGDIHDIGKNIVCLMLGNHGFDVVDLGKDVKAEDIVDAAVKHDAKLIGLSALMTTTMVRMEDTIDLLRQRALSIPVFVGGAVVTQAFADAIGAAGYSRDAVEAVRVAQNLIAVSA